MQLPELPPFSILSQSQIQTSKRPEVALSQDEKKKKKKKKKKKAV